MSKIILITGCSTGFGKLTAELLAKKGHIVYAATRFPENLQIASENIRPLELDVTWPQSKIDEAVNKIIQAENSLDVVINNAGFGYLGPTGNFTEQEAKAQFETNFYGQLKVTWAALPYLRKQHKGLVININSISGLVTTAFYGVYSASKFALTAATASLRFEEANNGIDIVSVHPGSYRTDFWKNIKWVESSLGLNEKIKRVIDKVKRHRGDPIKVAQKLVEIVETKNPQGTYLVGPDAYLIYFVFKFVPKGVIEWLGKRVVKNITK